jgi:hypothetical protein
MTRVQPLGALVPETATESTVMGMDKGRKHHYYNNKEKYTLRMVVTRPI